MTPFPRVRGAGRARLRQVVVAAAGLIFVGCSTPPVNPSFDLSVADAQAELRRMAREPRVPVRPLVIISGYGDPGFADGKIFRTIEPTLSDATVLRVSIVEGDGFEACRAFLLRAIDEAFPSSDPMATVEVDVIANSMGGLVALDAADPESGERFVRIARLFTISTPFRGANSAERFDLDNPLVQAMRPDSEFIAGLDAASARFDFEIVPYTRLGDWWVGAHNAAPRGRVAWWVPNRALQPAHLMAYSDPRILADIFRRLRGEEPFSTWPPAELPDGEIGDV